jgi:hypothetical protein
MTAKIGGIFRVVSGSGGTKTVERLVPETTTDAIPDFNHKVASKLAANTVFKTSTQFTTQNPTLLAGQFGQETDTKLVKLGDGSTAWNSLAYLSGNVTFKTSTQWTTAGSTVLASNQIGYETDTKYFKLGDGSTTYASLPYAKSPVNPDNVIRKTAAQWVTAGSTVLLEGQIGYETDTRYVKVGDGSTTYASLSYAKSPANDPVRKTTSGWSSAGSTVLLNGQLGIDTTTKCFKIGDGSTTWANLPYAYTPTTTVELTSGGTTSTTDTITLTLS